MASGRKEEARIKVGMDGKGVALLVAMKRRVLIMDIRDRIISHLFHILVTRQARGIVHRVEDNKIVGTIRS
jgi:hypothetical protein